MRAAEGVTFLYIGDGRRSGPRAAARAIRLPTVYQATYRAGSLPLSRIDSVMPATVTCARCGQTREGFDQPPLGVVGASAERLVNEVCQQCWADWLKQQTMLINHYGLNLMEPQARKFLTQNREAFLFRSGDQAGIDTTKEGTITH